MSCRWSTHEGVVILRGMALRGERIHSASQVGTDLKESSTAAILAFVKTALSIRAVIDFGESGGPIFLDLVEGNAYQSQRASSGIPCGVYPINYFDEHPVNEVDHSIA